MNNLIIFAGYPATGKTYAINNVLDMFMDCKYLSIDNIEEYFYEKYGFENIDEKKKIYKLSFEIFYLELEKNMKLNKDIIIDYPFSYLQYGKLKELSYKYKYNNITIRLTGELKTVYERRVKRDLNKSRNAGHLLNYYNKEMIITEDVRSENLITYSDFVYHCKLREYDKFKLGDLLVIDITNKFADIEKIKTFLKKEMI